MATVEELVQMMNTLQGQQHALNQEISRLTLENQQFRQAGSPGLAEIATAVGQAVQNMNLIFGLDETTGLHIKANYF